MKEEQYHPKPELLVEGSKGEILASVYFTCNNWAQLDFYDPNQLYSLSPEQQYDVLIRAKARLLTHYDKYRIEIEDQNREEYGAAVEEVAKRIEFLENLFETEDRKYRKAVGHYWNGD